MTAGQRNVPTIHTVQWNPDPANSGRNPPPISLHVSHQIYANLRIESGAGWEGQLLPFAPPPMATLMMKS